jgi:hypothetical protein
MKSFKVILKEEGNQNQTVNVQTLPQEQYSIYLQQN